MENGNRSSVPEFTLLGLANSSWMQMLFFSLFLLLYLLILLGNLLITVTVYLEPRLHSPMYFFLSCLSLLDLCYSTVTLPEMLVNLLSDNKNISFHQCIVQLFFLHFFGGTECFLLTLMAYDRYVAISNPLHYNQLMNIDRCCWLVASTWVAGFMHSFLQAALTAKVTFCGLKIIDHFFCDVHPLLALACTRDYFLEAMIVANSGTISLACFVVLLASYLGIAVTILRIRSEHGRSKAFSTCATHLLVVTLFFGPCVFIYMRPAVNYPADKVVSVLYTVLTPLLNPVIYTLRNQEVKLSMWRMCGYAKPPAKSKG
ncbi:olfactory receptor 4E2-like [Pleurodeles waltl]|uniref:olfactory receptor 4E2-like n=1 Tax=Pleurodeles waltl TaxID=8319 RepID=UPI0037094E1F